MESKQSVLLKIHPSNMLDLLDLLAIYLLARSIYNHIKTVTSLYIG